MNPDWLSDLIEFFGDCDDAADWLREPNDDLDGRSPLEAIRDGDQAEVVRAVELLTD